MFKEGDIEGVKYASIYSVSKSVVGFCVWSVPNQNVRLQTVIDFWVVYLDESKGPNVSE
jgi:hypothetical protein